MASKTNILELITRCKNQEWVAQKELYLHFADEMMGIAIRYTSDQSAAKDLVQETFLTFFKKIDQFDAKKGNAGAWISRILINQSFKDYRKKQKITFVDDAILATNVTNETTIIESLEAEDILNLLKKLPDGCRIIFNLKEIEGYNHNEIGSILGITASASRSQLTRAKKLLRQMIEKNTVAHLYSTSSMKAR